MESQQEQSIWRSVPQFGAWDGKSIGSSTNYSVIFNQARATRQQHKRDHRLSLGNEEDLIARYNHHHHHHHHHQDHRHHRHHHRRQHQHHHHQEEDDPVVRKKKMLSYFNCCKGA
ncbi:histidine-rich carboxyl terminus protein 1-like [Macadamia integrifolia]|uniref:histidine-rich carboxyl terminus protein 1-like n=1 Tax=Macadamia integrifolia TaxID=60698 RepID=UPI001C4E69F9|nr:histidine-rich carboxyl terminus protein 1-like [Macadamia integrifolia]